MDEKLSLDHQTAWAEDRTLMSAERTYNSALGAALGCVGVAIGLHAVFGTLTPVWAPKAVATLFLGISLLLIWSARSRAAQTHARLHQHDATPESARTMTMISLAVSLGVFAIGAIIWLI
ncbi:DUF202 domain-containing protein [Aquicoccus sp. G2-2]|uniref:DUF202 domain-containing protein n=1 Tax=Aquicoccus sp. G2-2 TaxID=3092120 RepID=UPI002ADFEAAD|nr:DUF202 domain-containing protein [Aquicoccus sp. G2-2]MEA1114457.1 DUF202 domain-containing protein [Aquicoccus sp. G2-2]